VEAATTRNAPRWSVSSRPALAEILAQGVEQVPLIPDQRPVQQAPQTRVPGRYFGLPGTLPVDDGHDTAAVYGILHGDADVPLAWLRAGEALSVGWLTATVQGLALLPISAVVEVLPARMALRRLLSGLGYPYLAVRIGYPDPNTPAPPATPRLAADEIIQS
jgi:hypothetical protein